jgi:hypothetical protein
MRRLIETAYAVLDETNAVEDYETQILAEDPMAFAASTSDPDTLHYNEAMNADASAECKKAMLNEGNAHTENGIRMYGRKPRCLQIKTSFHLSGHFVESNESTPARYISTRLASVSMEGGKSMESTTGRPTPSPVVNWVSIRLCLTLALLFQWKTRQIDFVLAFPQAEVECNLFMYLPRGLTFTGVHCRTHCLKLKRNLYGSHQAGRVWNQHLVNGLVNVLKFEQSVIDECIFYRGTNMLLIYMDDGILSGMSAKEIQTIIHQLGQFYNAH